MRNRQTLGAVLIMVLGMLMVLSALIGLFLSEVTREVQLRFQLSGKINLKHEAYNIMDIVQSQLEEHLTFSQAPLPKNPLKNIALNLPESLQVVVELTDESGKLPLNEINQTMLTAIFHLFGDIWDAQKLARDYIKWIKRKPVRSQIIESWNKSSTFKQLPEEKNPDNRQKKQPKDNVKDATQDNNLSEENNGMLFPNTLVHYDQLKEIESFRTIFFDKNGNGNNNLARLKACTSLLNTYPININSATTDVLTVLGKEFAFNLDAMERHLGLGENEEKNYYKNLEEINALGHGRLVLGTEKDLKNKNDMMRKQANKFITTKPHLIKTRIMVSEGDVSFLLESFWLKQLTTGTKKHKLKKTSQIDGRGEDYELELKLLEENGIL